jgi:hypothetical protein
MKYIHINQNIVLSFSVKTNIGYLKGNHIKFTIEKDIVTNVTNVSFITTLFDSNQSVIVKFPIDLISKICGIKSITITTLEEEKSNYYSDNSFQLIESIIEEKYGQPEFCNGTDEGLFFYINGVEMIHSIDEIRMGWMFHRIILTNNCKKNAELTNYNEFINLKNFVFDCIKGTNMELSFFYFFKDSLAFICNKESKGFHCVQSQDYFEIRPFIVKKTIDENGRTIISHSPLLEYVKRIKSKSIEEIKQFIKDYFSV